MPIINMHANNNEFPNDLILSKRFIACMNYIHTEYFINISAFVCVCVCVFFNSIFNKYANFTINVLAFLIILVFVYFIFCSVYIYIYYN